MTNIQSSSLESAIEIALQLHKGELREDSQDVPLIYHLTQVANLVHHACNLKGNELKEALIVAVLHESFNNVDARKRKELEVILRSNFGSIIMNNISLFEMGDKGVGLIEKSKIFTKIYNDVESKEKYLLCVLIADTISSMIKLTKQFPNAKYEEVDKYLDSLESLVRDKNIPKELNFMWNQKCEEVRRLFS
jgi:hypothetical protein